MPRKSKFQKLKGSSHTSGTVNQAVSTTAQAGTSLQASKFKDGLWPCAMSDTYVLQELEAISQLLPSGMQLSEPKSMA